MRLLAIFLLLICLSSCSKHEPQEKQNHELTEEDLSWGNLVSSKEDTPASNSLLSKNLSNELKKQHEDLFIDHKYKLKTNQAFIAAADIEYILEPIVNSKSSEAKRLASRRLKSMLDRSFSNLQMINDKGKSKQFTALDIATLNATYINAFAKAARFEDEKKYSKNALHIAGHIESSPYGAFLVDHVPDLSINGLMILAFIELYKSSTEIKYLEQATRAADWIIRNYSYNGGFSLSKKPVINPSELSLIDNLNMAKAMLGLYAATADREWLYHSQDTAKFIVDSFRYPEQQTTELVRFLNLLSHYTGNESFKQQSIFILKYLIREQLNERPDSAANILLADQELNNDPLHITIIASKTNKEAKSLFTEALQYPALYKRIEWYDPNEGNLLNHDVDYPIANSAAAFICSNKTCSLPIKEDLSKAIKESLQ